MELTLLPLIDDQKCVESVRKLRWPQAVTCPHCDSPQVWLRPHRGISQEKLPLYVGFFQFVHNARKRGKALLESLVAILVASPPRIAG